ncbi:MAG: ankyrin repeat domain-containing protein [Nitrospirae bacterium]|nr:ankyrin repeat domain-containing protein [Nitrospirota bacterium]
MRRITTGFLVLILMFSLTAYAGEREKKEKPEKHAKPPTFSPSSSGPLLIFGVYLGNFEMIEMALASGASVNAVDSERNTPLIVAAMAGRTDIAEFLIKKGANVNAKNNSGMTPLSIAISNNETLLIKLLKAAGAVS